MNFLSEVHFWSTKDDVTVKPTDFGTLKYFSKKDVNDGFLYNGKTSYCQHRGITRSPLHKRPFKIKDTLKELEGYLLQNKVVCSSWENNKLQLLLSRGILVIITININSSILTNISFNKSLCTKIQAELICDGVISGQQIVCACTDGRILCQGGVWKDGWTIDGGTKRKVSLTGELLCVWGRVNADHPQPWSPLLKDHQKANLLLYSVGMSGPELEAHKKTEGEPIDVIISKHQNKILFTIEQKVSLRGAVCVEVNTLELTTNTLNRIAVTSVPLQTQVCCCALSYNEKRLILGCIDGSVALLDRIRGSTHMIKTSIIPTFAAWHKCGAVVVFSNKKGQLQYFDTALNRINTQSAEDCMPGGLLDLSCYFNVQPDVSCINWGQKDLIVLVDHGPLIVITHLEASLSFTSLIKQYLKMSKIKQAIGVLLSWEWNDECFNALQRIVAHLLKLPLTEENAHNLQNSLSSFHNSPVPLSTSIKHKYGSQVRALTRRFFHQLVRYKIFETAFLLAVDIGHHDLFMDLYYCAITVGEKEMAAAARAQASALLSRCSSEASFCSRSACSQCSDSFIDSSNESSLQENQDKSSFSSSELSRPASTAFNDNFLTTNFNDINPKTYRTDLTLHDTDISKSAIFSKPFIYKTPPFSQISTFSGSIAAFNPVIKTPPLPVARPLPTASSMIDKHFPMASDITCMNPNFASIPTCTIGNPPTPFNSVPLWGSYTSANMASSDMLPIMDTDCNIQNSSISCSLPSSCSVTMTTSQNVQSQSSLYVPSQSTNLNVGKKQQAKVKFSDTVTAFIVPEVKRPIRPPPPPHITDPQKELADSLPLCHPNEDYLKDFTPARSQDDDELSTQPKIKVVHFGVV